MAVHWEYTILHTCSCEREEAGNLHYTKDKLFSRYSSYHM